LSLTDHDLQRCSAKEMGTTPGACATKSFPARDERRAFWAGRVRRHRCPSQATCRGRPRGAPQRPDACAVLVEKRRLFLPHRDDLGSIRERHRTPRRRNGFDLVKASSNLASEAVRGMSGANSWYVCRGGRPVLGGALERRCIRSGGRPGVRIASYWIPHVRRRAHVTDAAENQVWDNRYRAGSRPVAADTGAIASVCSLRIGSRRRCTDECDQPRRGHATVSAAPSFGQGMCGAQMYEVVQVGELARSRSVVCRRSGLRSRSTRTRQC
jgi:hypothetical protein